MSFIPVSSVLAEQINCMKNSTKRWFYLSISQCSGKSIQNSIPVVSLRGTL